MWLNCLEAEETLHWPIHGRRRRNVTWIRSEQDDSQKEAAGYWMYIYIYRPWGLLSL
jgi:hypothetical protein